MGALFIRTNLNVPRLARVPGNMRLVRQREELEVEVSTM